MLFENRIDVLSSQDIVPVKVPYSILIQWHIRYLKFLLTK